MTLLAEPQVLAPAGGLIVRGFDLSQPLSPRQRETIRAATAAHHVLVFPEQRLTREEQFAFAAHFGVVEAHGAHRGEAKRYGVAHVMTNLDSEGRPTIRRSAAANYHWHTDKPYLRAPPMLTMLHAVEVPPRGGDTEFANTALAYEALPEPMQRCVADLRVAFSPAFESEPARRTVVDHPLVRTHPETGKKALYLGNHATHIVGMPEEEGEALLAELLAHATQRRFVYRHQWREGDLVVWDNRCLLHRLVLDDDLGRYRRVMHRSIVKGTVPV